MNLLTSRTIFAAGVLLLFASRIPAADIGLAGTDPTIMLPTNPPAFSFITDSQGFYTAEYQNTSGYTFLNLIITGPADGINTVGCSPGGVFTGCSATIDSMKDLVTFLFSGGAGIPTGGQFFLTANNFNPFTTLAGTSTSTVLTGTPEPATFAPVLAVVALSLLLMYRRNLLKFRVTRE